MCTELKTFVDRCAKEERDYLLCKKILAVFQEVREAGTPLHIRTMVAKCGMDLSLFYRLIDEYPQVRYVFVRLPRRYFDSRLLMLRIKEAIQELLAENVRRISYVEISSKIFGEDRKSYLTQRSYTSPSIRNFVRRELQKALH